MPRDNVAYKNTKEIIVKMTKMIGSSVKSEGCYGFTLI